MDVDQVRSTLNLEVPEPERLVELFRRAGPVAIELERFADLGIWVLTAVDPDYPQKLREALGRGAPPVLFGSGEPKLANQGGLAIVGSRDASESALSFTRALAASCARGGTTVVTGAARGVDAASMAGSIVHGGTVVGIVADRLDRRIRDTDARAAISDDRLVLLTPYMPTVGFSARAAMGRNKLIYALSDAAVVVTTAADKGGTWAGALEALDAGRRVYVWTGGEERGRDALVDQGARPLPWDPVSSQVSPAEVEAWGQAAANADLPRPSSVEQPTLFGGSEGPHPPSKRRKKRDPAAPKKAPTRVVKVQPDAPARDVSPIVEAQGDLIADVAYGGTAPDRVPISHFLAGEARRSVYRAIEDEGRTVADVGPGWFQLAVLATPILAVSAITALVLEWADIRFGAESAEKAAATRAAGQGFLALYGAPKVWRWTNSAPESVADNLAILIAVRNELVHGARKPDPDLLAAASQRFELATNVGGEAFPYPWSLLSPSAARWYYDAASDAARSFLSAEPDPRWQPEARTWAAAFPPFGEGTEVSPIKPPVAATGAKLAGANAPKG
jgi:predicted Rossmann fold nucleotide-binding protein DprA/Smf involved in DNA uptake